MGRARASASGHGSRTTVGEPPALSYHRADARPVPSGGRPVITAPAVLDLSPGPLQDAVLRRVTAAVALQSGLSRDELGALALVAETLALGAAAAGCGGRLRVELHAGNGTVRVRLGPLGDGMGRAVIAATDVPPGGSPLARLAHDTGVERAGGDEFVCLVVGRPAA